MTMSRTGKLMVVGFGPGNFEHITERARQAIQEADVVIGYNTYVDLIRGLLSDQTIVRTGMTEEVSRAVEAVKQAEAGKKVAVISSGDAGVYGMAGLVYEVLVEKGWQEDTGVEVEVIPGISAIQSCASLLGAPVMHDSCCISLSDHLTPWETIARRVEAAGAGDFIVALYNPRSGRRTRQIVETQKILLKYRSPATPVGLVKSAYRDRQQVVLTNLGEMLEHDIGMLTTVIIGNSSTFVYDGKMITPRGYQRKYTLNREEQPLRPNERLLEAHEPWALHQGQSERVLRNQADYALNTAAESENGLVKAEQAGTATKIAVEGRPTSSRPDVESERKSGLDWAKEAIAQLAQRGWIETVPSAANPPQPAHPLAQQPTILELAVAPGVANKKISQQQMRAILELLADDGELEYTPHHYFLVRLLTQNPQSFVEKLQAVGLTVQPVGPVVQIKACDFCNGEKSEAIPYAEEIANRLGGLTVPKELKIGFAGCAMACYGSVQEDIAVVFRRGKFDLFLGGKAIGRNAHPAQRVAEGLPAAEIVNLLEQIVLEYKTKGYPEERFHKFFKRVGNIAGFVHADQAAAVEVDSVCGN